MHEQHTTGRTAGRATGRSGKLPPLYAPLEGPYSAMYGSDVVAARYCGFTEPPAPPVGLWMHGWYPESRPLDRPERLFHVTMGHLRDAHYWVTTDRQAAFLRRSGFPNARAIGLPLAYVPQPAVSREKGSLLVMPAHSLPAHDRAWATSDYVSAICALTPFFERVCVCVNGHDWDRGNWVDDFRGAGFEVIRGAGDASSLLRVADLFSRFEYVTTNGFGSLIAYASAFGAKASFSGPFSEITPESLKNVPFFIDNPELMAVEARCSEESYCRQLFPDFFRHPADAKERVEWGLTEIGRPYRASPEELKHLFGWSPAGRARSTATSLQRRARTAAGELVRPEARAQRRERCRLQAMEADAPGVTPLFGGTFAFTDARAFLDDYDECFERHAYRFRGVSRRPFVVDGDAGTGLRVLYFKSLYPECRVLALEADPTAFAVLERNCREYDLEDVELVSGMFPRDVALCDRPVGPSSSGAGQDLPVASGWPLPPFQFGDDLTETLDLLKLTLDGSQCSDLGGMAAFLSHVENVVLDILPEAAAPHALWALVGVLGDAGFRTALHSQDWRERRPLIELAGADYGGGRVRVLGVRM